MLLRKDEEVNRVKLVEYFSMEACNIIELFLIEHTNFHKLEERLTQVCANIGQYIKCKFVS